MSRLAPGPRPREAAVVTASCGTGEGRCEIGDALRLASRAHVLDLLHLLTTHGRLRFGVLRRLTRTNANVLSLRLRDLVDAGLVARHESSAGGPQVEYEATPAGHGLVGALEPLRRWARAHPREAATPPVSSARI